MSESPVSLEQKIEQLHVTLPQAAADFYIRILNGVVKEPTEHELTLLVNSYFPQFPLVPLSQERIGILKNDITHMLNGEFGFFNTTDWRAFAGDVICLSEGEAIDVTDANEGIQKNRKHGEAIILTGKYATFVHENGSVPYIDHNGKAALFDPFISTNIRAYVSESDSSHVESWETWLHADGMRPLFGVGFDDSYGFSEESFAEFVARARQQTGKDEIELLDIGGNIGLAAWQAEQSDPHITATNMTLYPEPALYPLRGKHQLTPAEQMSADWEEKFDVIISNVAFTHMRFQHIALVNAIMALAKGGMMRLNFGFTGYHYNTIDQQSMLTKEIPIVLKWLEKLQAKGVVEFLPEHEFVDFKWGRDRGEVIPYGVVSLSKVDSITQEDLDELKDILLEHESYPGLTVDYFADEE